MSVKTLNNAEAVDFQSRTSPTRTYSIAPLPQPDQTESPGPTATEIESFLQAENPVGCFRGVMWVMAFNLAVFLLGVMIWQSCKLLF
jgi:hypothetical protein